MVETIKATPIASDFGSRYDNHNAIPSRFPWIPKKTRETVFPPQWRPNAKAIFPVWSVTRQSKQPTTKVFKQ